MQHAKFDVSRVPHLGKDEGDAASDSLGAVEDGLIGEEQNLVICIFCQKI